MNKVMLVVLLLLCSLGCAVLAVEASATTPVAAPLPSTKVNQKDGAEMVLIPAGVFLMGTSEEQLAALLKADPTLKREWFAYEMPQRKVELDAYYIYKTEVTVAQYRKFCDATNRQMPREPSWKWQDIHPIVAVTWIGAKEYADWAGVTLPTEAQWEKAARGKDGRVYPWGNDWDAKKCSNSVGDYHPRKTSPVGNFPTDASPYGVIDMAGNVCEWCADRYVGNYYKTSLAKNPTGPETGAERVLRGGGWCDNNPGNFRTAFRNGFIPSGCSSSTGFRCVLNLPRQ